MLPWIPQHLPTSTFLNSDAVPESDVSNTKMKSALGDPEIPISSLFNVDAIHKSNIQNLQVYDASMDSGTPSSTLHNSNMVHKSEYHDDTTETATGSVRSGIVKPEPGSNDAATVTQAFNSDAEYTSWPPTKVSPPSQTLAPLSVDDRPVRLASDGGLIIANATISSGSQTTIQGVAIAFKEDDLVLNGTTHRIFQHTHAEVAAEQSDTSICLGSVMGFLTGSPTPSGAAGPVTNTAASSIIGTGGAMGPPSHRGHGSRQANPAMQFASLRILISVLIVFNSF